MYGSSPRLRGTRNKNSPCAICPPDHPRACGEHVTDHHFPCTWSGSSPRLRGTQIRLDHPCDFDRIIPAPAGNTLAEPITIGNVPDHPRACGEHRLDVPMKLSKYGSSPRLRGTRFRRQGDGLYFRIIPAPAGNTRGWRRICPPRTDHPRACGEHIALFPGDVAALGSSPRLRGTRRGGLADEPQGRIIPAPAGNTGTTECGFYAHFSRAQKPPKNTF